MRLGITTYWFLVSNMKHTHPLKRTKTHLKLCVALLYHNTQTQPLLSPNRKTSHLIKNLSLKRFLKPLFLHFTFRVLNSHRVIVAALSKSPDTDRMWCNFYRLLSFDLMPIMKHVQA